MKISFLGGASEVGGSCILVRIKDKNILLDSGIRQSASKDPLPDFRTIQENGGVDAIIISHAHLDHIGSLPIISKEYPNAKIYMNNMTKDLVRVLLYDSLKIMNNREAEIPMYAEVHVEEALNRIFTINYQVDFPIFEDIKITFYNAGHIAGASCVYIQSDEGSLFYSGDFSIFSQKSVEGAKIPKLRPDAAIFEATYGDKLHSNREVEEQRLISIVNECALNKGKMIIPAFALGRAQEVILILKKAMNKGSLKKCNIYVDGMVKNINNVYKFNPLYLHNSLGKKILRGIEPFYDDNITSVEKKEDREKLMERNEGCVIISSSGMITGGPSQYYAEKIASMENGYIVITGYQDEESPGRKLLNLLEAEEKDRLLEINNKVIPVKCKVEKVGLSAHGDKGEIKSLINLLAPKDTFLVHGEEGVIKGLAKELAEESRGRIYTPSCGELYSLNIYNPRRQWKKEFSYVMNNDFKLSEENIKTLWENILLNYGDKLFTLEELSYIWSGSSKLKVSERDEFQRIILNSVFFESDARRLFLFRAKKKEDVEEELKPKDLKQNELNEIVLNLFSEFKYKKASILLNERKVVLQFDFPKSVDKTICEKMEEFKGKTTWDIEINEQMNNNACEILIRELLSNASIKKISFYLVEDTVTVQLNEVYELKNEKEIFKNNTGLELQLLDGSSKGEGIENANEGFFSSNQKQEPIEQNKLLSVIDDKFKYEEFRPYKKSIKAKGLEKYIELSFVSPMVGARYNNKINELVKETGWSFSINKAVNQNEIINVAIKLCKDNGIFLKKNPSFNPANFSITLKINEELEESVIIELKKDFNNKTGCELYL